MAAPMQARKPGYPSPGPRFERLDFGRHAGDPGATNPEICRASTQKTILIVKILLIVFGVLAAIFAHKIS